MNYCPICNNETYRTHEINKVCYSCYNNTVDRDGNKVSFRNIDVFGGFKSIHYIKDNISERNEHVCYISNVKCYAEEGIYGGIIIYVKNGL